VLIKILPKPQVERQKRYQKAASSQVTWFPKTAWLTILAAVTWQFFSSFQRPILLATIGLWQ
jgi:hypothetical protein